MSHVQIMSNHMSQRNTSNVRPITMLYQNNFNLIINAAMILKLEERNKYYW